MLWTPKNHGIGDITIIRKGAEYHLFTEASRLGTPGGNVVLHAVSQDLLHWEELPQAIECGPPEAFDGHTIYHMDVFIHQDTWYMYYTGLDRRGAGQKQRVGLATSRDGITWEKSPHNPILRGDPRFYEPTLPAEAAYQPKDFDRECFRDPMIIPDEKTGAFGMIVVARDQHQPLDVRACLAWATSNDLEHWEAQPPIYSPGRFHTIETPSIFAHGGRHYAIFMTHPGWGPPVMTTDPYQQAGNFYAVSDHGVMGPYRQPEDEVVVAAHGSLRAGAQRIVEGPHGELYLYGWVLRLPAPDDEPVDVYWLAVPPPKRVHFTPAGELQVVFNDTLEKLGRPEPVTLASTADIASGDPAAWRFAEGLIGKHFSERRIARLPGVQTDVLFSSRIHLLRGERAGFLVRGAEDDSAGWQVIADRRFQRVEFGLLGGSSFIDARSCQLPDEFELKVLVYGECIEVYLDSRCLIHQVRHREKSGHLGYIVERGEAAFSDPRLRVL